MGCGWLPRQCGGMDHRVADPGTAERNSSACLPHAISAQPGGFHPAGPVEPALLVSSTSVNGPDRRGFHRVHRGPSSSALPTAASGLALQCWLRITVADAVLSIAKCARTRTVDGVCDTWARVPKLGWPQGGAPIKRVVPSPVGLWAVGLLRGGCPTGTREGRNRTPRLAAHVTRSNSSTVTRAKEGCVFGFGPSIVGCGVVLLLGGAASRRAGT